MRISLLCTSGTNQADTQTEGPAFRVQDEMVFDEVIVEPGPYYTPALTRATGDWCLIMTMHEMVSPDFVAALRTRCKQAEAQGIDGLCVTVRYRLDEQVYHVAEEYRAFKRADYVTIPPRPCAGVEGLTKGGALDGQWAITNQRYMSELRQEREAHLQVVHGYLDGAAEPNERWLAELALRIDPHLLEAAGEKAFLPDSFPLTTIRGINEKRAIALALAGIETPEHLAHTSVEYIEPQLAARNIRVSMKQIKRWQREAKRLLK